MTVDQFIGEYFFLSNMFPCKIFHEGVEYPSVENAYQASKTINMGLRYPFSEYTPRKSKAMGRKLPLRNDWEYVKFSIMHGLVHQKFMYHRNIGDKLIQIDGDIIEGNDWDDTYWGVCGGVGYNYLGLILVNVRDYIKEFGYGQ